MAYKKECELEDKECINCGECDICDLDRNKTCDNCCKCIDSGSDFKTVEIDEIIDDTVIDELDENELEEWKYEEEYSVNYSEDDK